MNDNIAALMHIKGKVHKWKNLTLILGVICALLVLRLGFGGNISNSLVETDSIAIININGTIFKDDFRSETLEDIAKNKAIKAVIINIDSPGGEIVGSEILFQNLRDIAKQKPIVVVMGPLAASGAYMAAIAADHIIAHNGTLTGSIGVLMQSMEFVDLANKLGVNFNSYKSSDLKGSPSPLEKSNAKVDKVINESIKDSYQFFVNLVKQRRGTKINNNKVFDGRAFTGRQALKFGLIDEIGGKKEALSYLKSRKIDVESLELKKIAINKEQEKIFGKFLNLLPFFNKNEAQNYSNKLMAVIP